MIKSLILSVSKAIFVISFVTLGAVSLNAQNRMITGSVSDQGGAPVAGATVMIANNTSVGTVTDVKGAFSISVPANSVLAVSCIGYVTQTFTAGSQSPYKITLKEDSEFLQETVIVGYGVQKKSDVTGAISQVGAQDMQNRSVADASQALQGKTSGVHIIQTSSSPGANATIRVRGFSSNAASDPLFIVDGLQVGNIGYLDPGVIESIEVLKDAASAAIYGAQAGNGVILITTKSGAKEKNGKVFFDAQYTINSLAKIPAVMNAQQYIGYMTEAGVLAASALAKYDGHTDTNWSDVTFCPSPTQRYNIGAEGGNDKGSYYTSFTYFDQNGIVRGDSDVYNRISMQVNADYKVKPWLTVGINSSFEKRKIRTVSENSEYGSMMTSVLNLDPLTPSLYSPDNLPEIYKVNMAKGLHYLTDANGMYYGVSQIAESEQTNPFIQRDNHDSSSEGFNGRGTVYANFTPIRDLVITSRFGFSFGYNNSSSYSFPYFASAQNKSDNYSLSATSSNNFYYQWENFANYSKKIGKNSFSAMAGMSYIESRSNYTTGSGDVLKSYAPNFRYLNYLTADCNDSTSGIESLSRNLSYLGRLGWTYDNRYMVQVNFRADAFDSSKLSAMNRWGYFPSISAGWTLSNEKFMKSVDKATLSFLKVRASWGQNGNVSVLNDYPYSTTVNIGNSSAFFGTSETLTFGSSPSRLANPNLKWETTSQYDFGADARFLKDRLSVVLDYYDKRTDGLLVNTTPVMETGQNSVVLNAGTVSNKGLELEMTWKDQIKDFRYSVKGNISTLKNVVTYLDPSITRISGTNFFDYTWTYFEKGYPTWYFRGYKCTGIDAETGNPSFADYNDDGKITSADAAFNLGSAIPDFTYGITVNMSYKNFDLSLFGTGSQGNEIVSCLHRLDRPLNNNLSLYYTQRWTETNKNSKYPKPGSSYQTEYWHSSAVVFDGSFFKVKQIQLGYTLPDKIAKKAKISTARLYVSLDDFFTITGYPGFDPEASSGATSAMGLDKGSFPPSKKVVFGINLAF